MLDRRFQERLFDRQRRRLAKSGAESHVLADRMLFGVAERLGMFAWAARCDSPDQQLTEVGLASCYLTGYCEASSMHFWLLLRGPARQVAPWLDSPPSGRFIQEEVVFLLELYGALAQAHLEDLPGSENHVSAARDLAKELRACAHRRGVDFSQLVPLVASSHWPAMTD